MAGAGASEPYEVDRATSRRRARRLQSYLSQNVWDPATPRSWNAFKCCFKAECKSSATKVGASFHESQGHSIGNCFDLSTAGGVPFRLLIVPMEAGGGERYVGVAGRTELVRESARLNFARTVPHEESRNAHMRGVTLALRVALGLPYADQYDQPLVGPHTEQVPFTDGTQGHLFECFAMANLLLCSSVLKAGSQKSVATSVMRANCSLHLARCIEILRPTLVISQGWGLVDTLWDAFGVTRQLDPKAPESYLANCALNGNQFTWVALKHPTRLWRSHKQPYFQDTVVPAIRTARRRALAVAARG